MPNKEDVCWQPQRKTKRRGNPNSYSSDSSFTAMFSFPLAFFVNGRVGGVIIQLFSPVSKTFPELCFGVSCRDWSHSFYFVLYQKWIPLITDRVLPYQQVLHIWLISRAWIASTSHHARSLCFLSEGLFVCTTLTGLFFFPFFTGRLMTSQRQVVPRLPAAASIPLDHHPISCSFYSFGRVDLHILIDIAHDIRNYREGRDLFFVLISERKNEKN